MKIKVELNGVEKELEVSPNEVFLDVLRRYGYKGTKKGCGRGECGVCTILVNGRVINSCLILAVKLNGKKVLTIEGVAPEKTKELSEKRELHPIQQAFLDAGAVQCGYCTPAMVLSTKALLDRKPFPTDEEIKVALDGVLCRCTGYVKIIDAVKLSAQKIKNIK